MLSGCSPSVTDPIPSTDQVVTERQRHIFAVGDSITAGYTLDPQQSYPSQLEAILREKGYKLRVINGGHSGDTSKQLLDRLERTTTDAQSGDIALLVIGANDAFQGLSLQELEQNIKKSIEMLQEKGMIVVLGGMQINPNLGPEYSTEFAKIYPRVAKEYGLTFFEFFLKDVAAIPQYNLADGIHPNQEGYSIIANNIANFLQQSVLSSEPKQQ